MCDLSKYECTLVESAVTAYSAGKSRFECVSESCVLVLIVVLACAWRDIEQFACTCVCVFIFV